jgi:hypothetical protein
MSSGRSSCLVNIQKVNFGRDLLRDSGLDIITDNISYCTKQLKINDVDVISVDLYSYTIKTNNDFDYNITIPLISFNGKIMPILMKVNDKSDMGAYYIFKKIDKYTNIIEDSSLDYRNNILLTSNNANNIISIMVDKEFINNISKSAKQKDISSLISRSFLAEVKNYSKIHNLKNFGYTAINDDNFNIFNLFWYKKDNLKFIHLTFNANNGDNYIRGYNYLLD